MVLVFVIIAFVIILFLSSYIKAGPNEAIRISGLGKPRMLIGRAGFRLPFLQRADKVSLEVFQVDIKTSEIPTNEFINIDVDGVANLKVSSNPLLLQRAFESILRKNNQDLTRQLQQVLQGNMREIIGTVEIRELVQDRQGVAAKIRDNVIPDMEKLGIELVNFNIQSFSDRNDVVNNLGIDNTAKISKDAAIAKANATKEIEIATAEAKEAANAAQVEAKKKIIEQNTELSLSESALKKKADTAKADADAAYELETQRRTQEINIATVNAQISRREREVELGNKEVELEERRLTASVNKKAEAEKFELEKKYEMQVIAAEAEKKARAQEAEALKIQAEAEATARIAKANADKEAALAEAAGIEAKGTAEAEAIEKKAKAMEKYGNAATLQLILDSGVLPSMVEAYSKPIAEAMGRIESITMYGEGNTAKLTEEITKNGSQIFEGLEKTLGIDLKSVVAGYLGGKLSASPKNNAEE